jgi:hypothetical protein
MNGRAFLDLARDLAQGRTEVYWRGAAIHAYYTLFLEGREALLRWGFAAAPRHNVHAFVRLKFAVTIDRDLKAIGDALDRLVRLRNKASYDLSFLPEFATPGKATNAVQQATTTLALLDAIDSDPVRRAAAIATIRP